MGHRPCLFCYFWLSKWSSFAAWSLISSRQILWDDPLAASKYRFMTTGQDRTSNDDHLLLRTCTSPLPTPTKLGKVDTQVSMVMLGHTET